MPLVYIHAAESLFAFGRAYFDEHQEKDAPHRVLGRRHRAVNHDWYQAFGKAWTFENPTPDWITQTIERIADEDGDEAAEIYQAVYMSHDLADRLNDGATPRERKIADAFHVFLLLHPEIIASKFQVDVIQGRIHRVVDGREVWESSPETVRDYERLRRYVDKVLSNDPEMQDIVAACEAHYQRCYVLISNSRYLRDDSS